MRDYGDHREKFDSVPPFKVTEIDSDRSATYDFLSY